MKPSNASLLKALERASIAAVLGYGVCGVYAALVSTRGLLIPIAIGLLFAMYCFLVVAGLIREAIGTTANREEEQTLTFMQLRAMVSYAPRLHLTAGFLGIGLVLFALIRFGGITLTTHETPTLYQSIGALVYLAGFQLIPLPVFSSTWRRLENHL